MPPSPNIEPTAAFTVDTNFGAAPLEVNFNAGDSIDEDGEIIEYSWDFGDGGEALGETAEHAYVDDGDYTVTLTITDDRGGTDSANATITVDSRISLSGTIQILASSAIDGDVNDSNAPITDNNSFETAQQLSNPATLGGYVNLPGEGESGALKEDGDPRDVYAVDLTGNETILLAVADSNSDLDLMLYDENGELVDASVNAGNSTESLHSQVAGKHYLEIVPVEGASNYVLTIGQNQYSEQQSLSLNKPFVSDEILVMLRGYQEPEVPGLHLRRRGPKGLRLMGVRDGAAALAQLRGGISTPIPQLARNISAERKKRLQTLYTIKSLRRLPQIRYAEPNLLRFASRIPNDTFYENQWHYPNINLPRAWDLTTGDESIIVAVIDTGVLLEHPDLQGQLVGGYDFIEDIARAGDGDGRDPDPNDPGDAQPGLPSSFHGTHVAGTVAAATNNGVGVAGVAWNSRIMPLRVLGIGGGTSFDLIQAILFAAGEPNASGELPERAADIINMSLGGDFFSQAEQDAILTARDRGLIVVAAAGNAGSVEPSYPAAYEGVISVSASTISKSLAFYSNRGESIDVAAPGGANNTDINGDGHGDGVASTLADDSNDELQYGYGILMGTSMAAPHVSGVAALMKAVYPQLSPTEFDQALSAGLLTDDLGDPGRDDEFGYGLINAQKAVTTAIGLANGDTEFPPLAAVTPGTLNFGVFEEQLGFDLVSVGGEGLEIQDISVAAEWLTIEPESIDESGVGRYRAIVTRDGLDDAIYSTKVTFSGNANPLELTVIMQVSSLDITADAGYHYVLLIDANTDQIADQLELLAENGEYDFRFRDVAPGRYQLIAGSDSDNDFLICDNGESCGSYQTLDSPLTFSVEESQAELNFVTGFLVNFADFGSSSLGPRADQAIGLPRVEKGIRRR